MFKIVHSNFIKAYDDIKCTDTHINIERCIMNIAFSFGGTWHTDDHISNYAVGCVIVVLKSYVIDYEFMSKFCYAWGNAKCDLDETSPEFQIFIECHKNQCFTNHCRSTNSIEME